MTMAVFWYNFIYEHWHLNFTWHKILRWNPLLALGPYKIGGRPSSAVLDQWIPNLAVYKNGQEGSLKYIFPDFLLKCAMHVYLIKPDVPQLQRTLPSCFPVLAILSLLHTSSERKLTTLHVNHSIYEHLIIVRVFFSFFIHYA